MTRSDFSTYDQQLNGTVTQLNFSFSLSAYHEHACRLAMPAGCDFNMRLYNPTNSVVASALTPSTTGANESFVYFNNGPLGTFKIQVFRVIGNGTFNLTVREIQKIVIDGGNPSHIERFDASYNSSGLWASTANRNPWALTNASFRSSLTSLRMEGAGDLIFDTPAGAGTLVTPLFDITANSQYMITLGYRLVVNFGFGTGYLQMERNATGTWTDIFTFNSLANEWTRVQVNLSAYKGSHVRFRISLNGVGAYGYFYIDDLQVSVVTTSTPYFSDPVLSPLIGNIYETFHVQVKYTYLSNIFPSDIYVSVWDNLVPNVKRIDLVEIDPTDWDLTNGKLYECDFQLFDVGTPYLYCVSSQLVLPYALYFPPLRYWLPNMSEPLDDETLPYLLDFEGGDTYYTINDPVYVTPTIATNAYGHFFNTGTSTGSISNNALVAIIGVATPWINVGSGMQFFIEYDVNFDEIVQNPVNALKVNITTNGVTWVTIAEFTSDVVGKQAINITTYENHNVSVRFFMESSVGAGYRSASFTLDNVTISEKDFVSPTMSNPSISDDQWLFGVVNVDMIVDDVGFGVDHVKVYVDGTHVATITSFPGKKAQFSIDTTRFGNGDHEINITVVDKSGNQNSYTIIVHIDNMPYWLFAVIAGAAVVFGIYFYRRLKVAKPAIQRKIRGEAIPPTDVAKKILEITNIFRQITASDLAKKIAIKGLTAETTLAYLRYMVNEGMIKGDLEDDVFTRVMSGKMKAIIAGKEAAIVDYLRGKNQTSVPDMIKDLHLEAVRREVVEDFVMGLVVAGKLNCYFEGDMIFIEEEVAAKVKEVLPELAPKPEPAPRAAKRKVVAKEEETEEPDAPAGFEKILKKASEATRQAHARPAEEPSAAVEAKDEAPAKAPWTLADKKADIVRLLSSKEHVKFDEIKKEFALNEAPEEIEDYLFDLIKKREIKGIIEEDGFSMRE